MTTLTPRLEMAVRCLDILATNGGASASDLELVRTLLSEIAAPPAPPVAPPKPPTPAKKPLPAKGSKSGLKGHQSLSEGLEAIGYKATHAEAIALGSSVARLYRRASTKAAPTFYGVKRYPAKWLEGALRQLLNMETKV